MARKDRPEWAYHVTSSIYLDAIAKEGLLPSDQAGFGNVLFFSDSPILDYGDVPIRFPWPKDARAFGKASGQWVTKVPVYAKNVEVFTGKEGHEDIDWDDWVALIPALKAGLI
jgi:hypothetical protein